MERGFSPRKIRTSRIFRSTMQGAKSGASSPTASVATVIVNRRADVRPCRLQPTAARFLQALIAAVPYRLHTVLTDNGLQFTDLPRIRDGRIARYCVHPFREGTVRNFVRGWA